MQRERGEFAWTEDSIRLVVTPSAFAVQSLQYVQEAGHFKAMPRYYTEREQLASYLVVYTIAGRGKLHYRGKSHRLLPGNVFWIDCREYQHYQADTEETAQSPAWELSWVHFAGGASQAYYEQFAAAPQFPVLTLPAHSPVPERLRTIIQANVAPSYRSELASAHELHGLMTDLVLASKELSGPVGADAPLLVSKLSQELGLRYREPLSLDQLAHQFAVSKYYLAKIFKLHTGFSPGAYLIHLRITAAQELLRYSDRSVAAVAEAVGIENVTHFINLFKARTGYTPLAYRKRWQGGNGSGNWLG